MQKSHSTMPPCRSGGTSWPNAVCMRACGSVPIIGVLIEEYCPAALLKMTVHFLRIVARFSLHSGWNRRTVWLLRNNPGLNAFHGKISFGGKISAAQKRPIVMVSVPPRRRKTLARFGHITPTQPNATPSSNSQHIGAKCLTQTVWKVGCLGGFFVRFSSLSSSLVVSDAVNLLPE
jgi:hypothetical protein